jgi:hypothetical protein
MLDIIFNVWGHPLGDATGEPRPPKATQIKHVPQHSIRRGLGTIQRGLGMQLDILNKTPRGFPFKEEKKAKFEETM